MSEFVLSVRIDGQEVCTIGHENIPCEKTFSKRVANGSLVTFKDEKGVSHDHHLDSLAGWAHFSVRVHASYACQIDCVITESEAYQPSDFLKEGSIGVRFQPILLPGAKGTNEELHGRGLFRRGLHFTGTVTPGNVLLSCECDSCGKSFLIHSFHCGFSNSGYFYSGSGKYTLVLSDRIAGSPGALHEPNPDQLKALEAKLPKAPDGSDYRYLNPFRCPHCSKPYIDFESDPKTRASEYYGNYLFGVEPQRYEPG